MGFNEKINKITTLLLLYSKMIDFVDSLIRAFIIGSNGPILFYTIPSDFVYDSAQNNYVEILLMKCDKMED